MLTFMKIVRSNGNLSEGSSGDRSSESSGDTEFRGEFREFRGHNTN
jgi:hypothetical protein